MVDSAACCSVGEVVGPAGAGKSTLLSALITQDGAIAAGVPLSGGGKLASLARLTGVLVSLLPAAARTGSWVTWEEVRCAIYLDAWQRVLRDRTKSDVAVLMDQGPVFRLAVLSEFASPVLKSERFRRWCNARLEEWADVLDVVIHVDAPDDVLLRRIRERERYHLLKDETDEHGRSLLARYRRAYDTILNELARKGRTRILRFDTAQTTTDVIAEAVSKAFPAKRASESPVTENSKHPVTSR